MSRTRTIHNTTLSTSTGTLPAVDLYQVCGTVAANVNHGSTKTIAWKMQGSLSGVHWADLNAAATTSTGTAAVLSTASGLFNRVRIVVTANNTTGDTVTKWAVAGKP
jgi:hypothetical protein